MRTIYWPLYPTAEKVICLGISRQVCYTATFLCFPAYQGNDTSLDKYKFLLSNIYTSYLLTFIENYSRNTQLNGQYASEKPADIDLEFPAVVKVKQGRSSGRRFHHSEAFTLPSIWKDNSNIP